jgi:hypothetical protein
MPRARGMINWKLASNKVQNLQTGFHINTPLPFLSVPTGSKTVE